MRGSGEQSGLGFGDLLQGPTGEGEPVAVLPGVLALLQVGRQLARDAGTAGPAQHAADAVAGRQVGVAVRVRRRGMLAANAQ